MGGSKEKHRLKQNAKLLDGIGSMASETTYFPNANNSGECGDIELVSVKICGHLLTASKLISVWSWKRWKQRMKLLEIDTGCALVYITGCAGKCS